MTNNHHGNISSCPETNVCVYVHALNQANQSLNCPLWGLC